MSITCPTCGAELVVPEASEGSVAPPIRCPTCHQVFDREDGNEVQVQHAPAGAVPPRKVPPPVSAELAKTRRMSTSDFPFLDGASTGCANHPDVGATLLCEKCRSGLCGPCGGSAASPLCPRCTAPMSPVATG